MNECDRACDWDLHAIVKAQITTNCNNTMNLSPYSTSCYQLPFDQTNDYTTIYNELENICKPFDPLKNPIISSPIDSSFVNDPTKKIKRKRSASTNTQAITSRRRRNKDKITRSVREAAGDHLLSDKWNRRKYGEKAIKGSLYRRSYNRCSNSRGCKERKQVEQSSNDPTIFLITCIDEHSYPCPTHSQSCHNIRRSNA